MATIFEDNDPSFGKDDLIEVAKDAAAPAPALVKAPEPAKPATPAAKPNVFLEGDKVLHTMREIEGVVIKNIDPAPNGAERVLVQFKGRSPEPVTTKNLKLLHKGTDVQQALRNDPEALNELVKWVHRIEITGNPNDVDKLAEAVSSNSSLPPSQAIDYVKPTSEASHGGKFDILVDENIPNDLQDRLGVFFFPAGQGQRARVGEKQINSRALALWLMKNHGFLPRKWS